MTFSQPQLDDNLERPLPKVKGEPLFESNFRVYGIAPIKIDGTVRYATVSAVIDMNGKLGAFKQHYHTEEEKEFAGDSLKKVLADLERVRY